MNIDSLVAINLFNKKSNTLINNIPILYYWNGTGDLLSNILNNISFKEKYFDNISFDEYSNLSLGYFYFKYDENNEEVYTDNIIDISKYLKLTQFNSSNIVNELIIKNLFILYEKTIKEKYNNAQVFNEDIILDIYNKIKDKYKDKIVKESFINWIRSQIINKDNLDNTNANYVINKLTNILKEV